MDRTPRLWFRFPVGEECHKQPWPDLVLTAEPIKTGSMLLCIVQYLYVIMYKQPQGVGRSSFWGTKAKVEYFVLFVAKCILGIHLQLRKMMTKRFFSLLTHSLRCCGAKVFWGLSDKVSVTVYGFVVCRKLSCFG